MEAEGTKANHEEAHYSYESCLIDERDVLFHRARRGLKILKGLHLFLQQTAVIEENYGTAISKVGGWLYG